jgi:putative flavoprotein involved in K+ transport
MTSLVMAASSSVSTSDDAYDAIVIGGGQAGLAVAYHLANAGSRFVVLDAGDAVGHVWRSRWDSLTLFTAGRYDALPGMAFPGDPDRYPTKDDVADYLQTYAERFSLPVRLRSKVTRLSRVGGRFCVEVDGETLWAHQVVVATGAFQVPVVPGLAAGLSPDVVQLHSADYRRPSQLPDVPVLVVGASNSGIQIAEELAATREVHLAVGARPRMVRQRPLGKDIFWWLTRLGLVSAPADSRLGRKMQSGPEIIPGGSWARLSRLGVGVHPRLESADGAAVRFADGSMLDVGAVVWSTGYRSDWGWVDVPGVVRGGEIAHTHGVTDVPGLSFIGLPWQHSRGSALLGFVKHDAAWLAERIIAGAPSIRREPAGAPAMSS